MLFRTAGKWQECLIGVYTGGTPNLVSLKVALDVDPNLFVMTSTYDMIVGAVTIIFFITAGPRIFRAYSSYLLNMIAALIDTDACSCRSREL